MLLSSSLNWRETLLQQTQYNNIARKKYITAIVPNAILPTVILLNAILPNLPFYPMSTYQCSLIFSFNYPMFGCDSFIFSHTGHLIIYETFNKYI